MVKTRGSVRDISLCKSADIEETAQREDEISLTKQPQLSCAPSTRRSLKGSGSNLATKANYPESRGNKPTANSGPWTAEEHKLFLQGYRKYKDCKNRWQMIAREFVHTRTSKQVGIHGYFCTELNKGAGDAVVAQTTNLEVLEKQGKEKKVRKQKQNDGNASKLAAKTQKNEGFENNACADRDGEARGEGKSESNDLGAGDEEDNNSDDGNFNQCIICNNPGVLYCCSKCPRAFHAKCLAKDGCSDDVKVLPPQWICHRCELDREISSDETDEMSLFSMNRKIKTAYTKFNDHNCPNYTYCAMLLGLMAQIINKLKMYDFGYIFSDPVDPSDAPNYFDIIKTPMDYSTIVSKLEDGGYAESAAMQNTNGSNASCDDEVECQTAMERILCCVIRDVNQVFYNCLVFNAESTSFYRAAEVHIRKWEAYLNHFVIHRLPQNVRRFIEKIELAESSMQSTEFKHTPQPKNESADDMTDEKMIETVSETTNLDVRGIVGDAIDEKCKESIKSERKPTISFSDRPDTNFVADNESTASSFQTGLWTDQEHTKFIENHKKYGDQWDKRSEEFVLTQTARQIQTHTLLNLPSKGQWKGNKEVSVVESTDSTTKFHGAQPDEIKSDTPALVADPDVASRPFKRRKKTKKLSDDSPLSNNNQLEKKISPVLLLTKEQVMALEHVFFTPIEDLCKEVVPIDFDDYINTYVIDSTESGDAMVEDTAPDHTKNVGGQLTKEANKTSSKNDLTSMNITPDEVSSAPNLLEKTNKRGDMVQRLWYERLRDLRNHKIAHGNALVSSSLHMKLYSWCNRQRKRYGQFVLFAPYWFSQFAKDILTLFRV